MNVKRIVWPRAGEAVLEAFELSEEVPVGHVLLESEVTLVSPGTERDGLLDRPNAWGGAPFPRYPGYNATGRVLEVGDGVEGLAVGDRVVAYHSPHASHSLKAARDIVKVEHGGLESRHAVFSILAAMSLQGIRKLEPELGESVMVMGLGLLGLFATQFARLVGGLPVIVLDYSAERRELALKLGADHAFHPEEEGLVEKIRSLTGKGVNAIAEITGAPEAVKQALELVSPMGRIALIGCSRTPTEELDFYRLVHKRGVSLIGAHNFIRPREDSRPGYWTLRDDLRTILHLLASGRMEADAMIAEIVSPEEAPTVYGRMAEGVVTNPPGVLFDWGRIR